MQNVTVLLPLLSCLLLFAAIDVEPAHGDKHGVTCAGETPEHEAETRNTG